MNKTEKLKKRLDMILAPTGIDEATMEIVESQFLKACKEEGLEFMNKDAEFGEFSPMEEMDI